MRFGPALAGLLLAATAFGGSAGWEKVSEQDGIIVYAKDLEGSDTISIRGEALIDATLDDIFNVMKDNATAHEWMPLMVAKRDLKATSATERIEYTHLGMPWPVTDRYFINTGKAEYLPGGVLRLSVKSVESPDPAWLEPDKVLGVLHYSEFLLTPVDGGRRTHVTLEINSDPKGLIPKFLVNMAQKSWPRDFFKGLTRQLAKHGKLTAPSLAH